MNVGRFRTLAVPPRAPPLPTSGARRSASGRAGGRAHHADRPRSGGRWCRCSRPKVRHEIGPAGVGHGHWDRACRPWCWPACRCDGRPRPPPAGPLSASVATAVRARGRSGTRPGCRGCRGDRSREEIVPDVNVAKRVGMNARRRRRMPHDAGKLVHRANRPGRMTKIVRKSSAQMGASWGLESKTPPPIPATPRASGTGVCRELANALFPELASERRITGRSPRRRGPRLESPEAAHQHPTQGKSGRPA